MKKETSKKTVRNNGIRIGEMLTYNKSLRRATIFGTYILVSVAAFSLGRASKSRPINAIIPNTLTEKYFDEPTYSGIPYVVDSGDTLSAIVYSYESDTNKAMRDISLIEEYNDIDKNDLHPGDTIYLVGVPASKLEDFGYTDNYNYFEPSVEVELRLSFLNKVVDRVLAIPDHDDEFISAVRKVENDYNDYKDEYVDGDEYKLDYIINVLRDLSIDAKDFGFSFDNNLKALPLSEAENYETFKGL